MKELYIIGNGFDLHHGLNTWYSSFGLYLQENNSEIYDLLVRYIGMPELDREIEDTLNAQEWNEFEISMSKLFFDEIIDDNLEYAADLGSDDYYKDLGAIEMYVSDIRDKLTTGLFKEFKAFIQQIDYPELDLRLELNINSDARFFNFNYTSSLQRYYGVMDSNIKYVHNNAESEDILILGHGFSPDSFEPVEPKPPENASEEELQEWYDFMSEQSDMSIDMGKSALQKYFTNSYKNTDKVISENIEYFESLYDIEKIIVFGHSLSFVDEKYIQKILSSVNQNCKWFVSCRNSLEVEAKKNRLIEIGVSEEKIQPFNVSTLLKSPTDSNELN